MPTIPPDESSDTIIPIDVPTSPDLPVIPAGGAEEAVREAFAALQATMRHAEAVAHACARALDAASTRDGMRQP